MMKSRKKKKIADVKNIKENKRSQSLKKKENDDQIDDQTPKTKYKSIMKRFEKNGEKSDENNVSVSFHSIKSLGESILGESSQTLTPSSVKKVNKSAVARAPRGQLFTDIRPNKMLNEKKSDEKNNLKGKRKLIADVNGKNEYFSPKKIPKLTKFFNDFSSARLGVNPGEGPASERPGVSGKCPEGH